MMPSDDERLTNQADCQALSGAPGVVAGRMFGMRTLKVGGKAFASVYGDGMIFKLSPGWGL